MAQPAAQHKDEAASLPGGNTVLVEFEDGIAWVTMNRPEKRNAMSPTLASRNARTCSTRWRPTSAARSWCSPARATAFSRRHGPEGILPRHRPSLAARARAHLPHQRGVAVAPAPVLSEADHRDGQRLVLRRRVHAAGLLRSRDRGRGSDVRSVGDQLGHHPGRRRDQGGGAGDEPARRALLHHDRRDLRRPQGRQHEPRQRGGAAARTCASAPGSSRRP